jgi:hypothetical protein
MRWGYSSRNNEDRIIRLYFVGSKDLEDFRLSSLLLKLVILAHRNASMKNADRKLPVQEPAAYRISMSVEKRKVCGIEVHKSLLIATMFDREGNSHTKRVSQDIESLLGLREWVLSDSVIHLRSNQPAITGDPCS